MPVLKTVPVLKTAPVLMASRFASANTINLTAPAPPAFTGAVKRSVPPPSPNPAYQLSRHHAVPHPAVSVCLHLRLRLRMHLRLRIAP